MVSTAYKYPPVNATRLYIHAHYGPYILYFSSTFVPLKPNSCKYATELLWYI